MRRIPPRPPYGEGRGRRVSRAVRLSLGRYDEAYDSLVAFHAGTVDWVGGGPWTSDVVKVSVTKDGQQQSGQEAGHAVS